MADGFLYLIGRAIIERAMADDMTVLPAEGVMVALTAGPPAVGASVNVEPPTTKELSMATAWSLSVSLTRSQAVSCEYQKLAGASGSKQAEPRAGGSRSLIVVTGHEAAGGLHYVYGPEPGQTTRCHQCGQVGLADQRDAVLDDRLAGFGERAVAALRRGEVGLDLARWEGAAPRASADFVHHTVEMLSNRERCASPKGRGPAPRPTWRCRSATGATPRASARRLAASRPGIRLAEGRAVRGGARPAVRLPGGPRRARGSLFG